jgi:hypothetical protein
MLDTVIANQERILENQEKILGGGTQSASATQGA